MPDPDRSLGEAAVAWARELLDAMPADQLAELRARFVEPALAAASVPAAPQRRPSWSRPLRSRPASYPRARRSGPRSAPRPPSR